MNAKRTSAARAGLTGAHFFSRHYDFTRLYKVRMNLLLLNEDEAPPTAPGEATALVRVTGRRAEHITSVLRARPGDELRIGIIGGKIGKGRISALADNGDVDLELKASWFDCDPPAPVPLTLFLALPRPKFLLKTVQTATTLGIKRIFLMNSYKVEKVYWHCDQLSASRLREACVLGLEQARDTVLPEITLKRTFKPFVEDEVPKLILGSRALVAHPGAAEACPYGLREPVTLAIGPEGGFIDYEIKKLSHAGFTPIRLTERILKVETAVTALISRLT